MRCCLSLSSTELTSALGAAISATKTISFRYLLTGPLSSTAKPFASSKPPFGAGRVETDLEERKTLLRHSQSRMSMYSIQTVLSPSLLVLLLLPLKVWNRRKEMRGRNRRGTRKRSRCSASKRQRLQDAEWIGDGRPYLHPAGRQGTKIHVLISIRYA